MTPIIINARNKFMFQNLVSERVFELLGESGVLAVGCSEQGLACGAMVCTLDGDETVEVKWLFVAEEKRREHCAELMITTVCNTMRSSGYRTLYFVMSDKNDNSAIKGLLNKLKFEFIPVTDDFVTVPIDKLFNMLDRGNYSDGNCFVLKEIPKHYLVSFMEGLEDDVRESIAPLLDRSEPLTDFHECSCGVIRDKVLKGLLLFKLRTSNDGVTLTCVMNRTSSPVSLIQMLRYSAKIAKNICPEGSVFSFATLNGLGESMLELLGTDASQLPITCAYKTFE